MNGRIIPVFDSSPGLLNNTMSLLFQALGELITVDMLVSTLHVQQHNFMYICVSIHVFYVDKRNKFKVRMCMFYSTNKVSNDQ